MWDYRGRGAQGLQRVVSLAFKGKGRLIDNVSFSQHATKGMASPLPIHNQVHSSLMMGQDMKDTGSKKAPQVEIFYL